MLAEAGTIAPGRRKALQVIPPTQQQMRQEVGLRSEALNGSRIPVKNVLIAQPLGFCAGVVRAISALDQMVAMHPDKTVYSYHVIVHNDQVQRYFEEDRGVVFVNDVSEVPKGAPLMLSAHGTAPAVARQARERTPLLVDAACPLVTKTHREIANGGPEGPQIIYIGHRGHDESQGASGVAPERFHLVESVEDVGRVGEQLGAEAKVAVVMQTTLAQSEVQPIAGAVQEIWPNAWTPPRSDICFATTNRQEAIRDTIKAGAENVLVVTSPSSSNGKALVRVASAAGAEAFLVQEPGDIPQSVRDTTIGITAAASTPWDQIFYVMAGLNSANGLRFMSGRGETERFGKPRDLVRLGQQ